MDLKLLSAIGAAGAAGDSAIGVEDVFKTYVYTGNSTARDITTNVDMSGSGMVWLKNRTDNVSHVLYDTERGVNKRLRADTNTTEDTQANTLTAFNSDGFSLGTDPTTSAVNNSGTDYVSYSFKKQEKFFTTITYAGNDANNRQIAHDLGSTPGCLIIKIRNLGNVDWYVWHRGLNGGTNSEQYALKLNTTDNQADNDGMGDTLPTSTHFTVHDNMLTNAANFTYVAYLFAHEEAEFGRESDQKIISCSSYTGNGGTDKEVTLPFEPQFLLIKNTSDNYTGWMIADTMRGIISTGTSNDDKVLKANNNDGEVSWNRLEITPTGFKLTDNDVAWNGDGKNYIYIAIAAETGKTSKVPENGSDVFAMDTGNSSSSIPSMDSNFAVDMAIYTKPASTAHNWLTARLIGQKELKINGNDTEGSVSDSQWDSNVGWGENHNSTYQSWLWKRSAGFDCLTYKATGVAGLQINHNLGVVPEMAWCKRRDGSARDWMVYHKGLNGGTNPEQYHLVLNSSDAEGDSTNRWNDTAPTASVVTLGSSQVTNDTGLSNFIMLLFSTVSGISKCGYHTCGAGNVTLSMDFSPRFLLLKNISTGSTPWVVIDTLRGITANAGNTPTFNLSSEWGQSNYTWIQSISSSGIEINAGQGDRFSNDGDDFIWYAHA